MKLVIVFLCVSIFALNNPSAFAQSESPTDALDVDQSGVVDFADFLAFASVFGSTDLRFDLDLSGSVDFPDFLAFAQSFNQPTRFEGRIVFADSRVEAIVRDAIEDPPDVLKMEHVLPIETLLIKGIFYDPNPEIDLTGIDALTSLRELTIRSFIVKNVEPLQALPNLESLTLYKSIRQGGFGTLGSLQTLTALKIDLPLRDDWLPARHAQP